MNKIIAILGIAALLVGVSVQVYKSNHKGDIRSQLQNATYLYDQLKIVPKFQFIDHEGQPFTNEDLKDQWTLWFFGFTHCPDICPTTLSILTGVINQLEEEHGIENTSIIFVSVDPERDTPDKMKAYANAFHEDAIGITAYDETLAPFLRNMGIIATIQKQNDFQTDYLVDHSSAVYLIAPDTGISALFSVPHRIDTITDDFLTIRKHHSS
ncbi:MAG: SCO family protein [Pseudomonadota bacterium]